MFETRTVFRTVFLSAVFALTIAGVSSEAQAQLARPATGCPTPTYSPSGRNFYVDPVRGSMQGDGSQSRPWHTFSEVLAANLVVSQTYGSGNPNGSAGFKPKNPNGVIKAGDTVHLMSGDHGVVTLAGHVNPSFIRVMADKGQSPVIEGLVINGSANWDFEGLTFQSLAAPGKGKGGYLIRLGQSMFLGPVSNIYFHGNHLCSQPDVRAWTQDDWKNYGKSGVALFGTNISFIGNDLRNVRAGIGASGTNELVEDNSIDNFGDDGIDFSGDLITIRRNRISNSHVLGDGNHNDGMQGQIRFSDGKPDLTPHHDILIDSNFVAAITDRSLPFLSDGVIGGMQGISEFDGVWSHLTIVNNVVLTTAYHGISVYGATDSQIINNTVEEQSLNPKLKAWIGVFDMKKNEGGTQSANIVVRNNAAPILPKPAPGIIEDHNVALVKGTATDSKLCFQDFEPQVKFDMRLRANCPLVGVGTSSMAPAADILGVRRSSAIDVGAYAAR